jgi:hypothetical protein
MFLMANRHEEWMDIMNLNLSAPTAIVFLIALVAAILGLLVKYGGMSVGLEAFHWALLAYIILAAGTLFKGL